MTNFAQILKALRLEKGQGDISKNVVDLTKKTVSMFREYFKCAISLSSSGLVISSPSVAKDTVETVLEKVVETLVLCPGCGLPELVHKSPTSAKCSSCGTRKKY